MDAPSPSRRSLIATAIAVFATAVALRMPSCYESFWLDELHSAWAVWGDLEDVISRADQGHQSPFYFLGLWFWKQAVGQSELALRMSSVLAVALSGVVITIGVANWTRSLAAAAVAGMVVAIESNSIFFGTELRPYALVILFSSLAVVLFLHLLNLPSRHSQRRLWTLFVVAILLAMLSQPTAIGVLVLLPLSLTIVWSVRDRRELFKFSLVDGLLALASTAVCSALWRATLGESWDQRSDWASFATASHLREIWQVWDWTWLWIIPVALLLCTAAVDKWRKETTSELFCGSLLLAWIAVVATSFFWIVSYAPWVPVWHRRYFIALLPVFACLAGGSVGMVSHRWKHQAVTAWSAAALIVLSLGFAQGTLRQIPRYPVALAHRGENWRDAIEWVRAHADPRDQIYLDSGLIETHILFDSFHNDLHPQQLEYFAFPTSGPYDLGSHVKPIPPGVFLSAVRDDQRTFILTRRAASQIDRSKWPTDHRLFSFGNVSVIFTPSELDRRS